MITKDHSHATACGALPVCLGRTKISAIRGDKYDTLLGIVFTRTFELEGAHQATRSVVEQMFGWSTHVNGRQPTITKRCINDPQVVDVDLSAAYQRIISTSLPVDEL